MKNNFNNQERFILMCANFIISLVCGVYALIKYCQSEFSDVVVFVLAVGVFNLALAFGSLANYKLIKEREENGKR